MNSRKILSPALLRLKPQDRVVVVGLGISGKSAALLLSKMGFEAVLSEKRELTASDPEIRDLNLNRIRIESGGHSEGLFLASKLIVLSPGVPFDLPILQKCRSRGIPVIGEVELAWRLMSNPVIAVTGTNGKSTTVTWTAHVMRESGIPVELVGNIGKPVTGIVGTVSDETWLVEEISSFQLETIEYFKPRIAVCLNFAPDHLDRHKTVEEYYKMKLKIFKNQDADDTALLNSDDSICREASSGLPIKPLFFGGKGDRGEYVFLKQGDIRYRSNDHEHIMGNAGSLPLPGIHNVENAMAVCAACLSAGIDATAIWKALLTFKGLDHRMQKVLEKDGIVYYNDSKATNPAATIKSLESFSCPLILIAGGKDKGLDPAELAPHLKNVRYVVTLGETGPYIQKIIRNIVPGMHAKSMEEALRTACRKAKRGDAVLFSPAASSFDMFDNFEHRGKVFTETLTRVCSHNENELSAV